MEELKEMLARTDIRGVIRTTTGEVLEFHNTGVKDLFTLLESRPHILEGAYVADRVIGRGAALLLALGHVERIFAQIISAQAIQVLQDASISFDFDKLVPNIINRDGTDICPVEKLTMDLQDPVLAFDRIKEFLINNNII